MPTHDSDRGFCFAPLQFVETLRVLEVVDHGECSIARLWVLFLASARKLFVV